MSLRPGENAPDGKPALLANVNLPRIAKNAVLGQHGNPDGGQRSATRLVDQPVGSQLRLIESQRKLGLGDGQLEGKPAAGQRCISKLPLSLTKSKSILGRLETQPAAEDLTHLRGGERA